MNRLRIKLSEKRAISLDIPDLKKKFWPFYLAELVQYLALLVSVSLFVIGQFDDDFDNIDFFKLIIGSVVLVGGMQLIKMLLGGLRYFPESRFDLYSLLLLIGLISTLLVKQFSDLVDDEGMFPSQLYWHFTIWGLLVLLAMSYLIDVISRNLRWLKFFGVFAFLFLEGAVIVQFIATGEMNMGESFFVLINAPLLCSIIFYAKDWGIKLSLAINALLVSLFAFLNLTEDFVLVAATGSILLTIGLVFSRQLGKKEIQEFLFVLKKRSFRKIEARTVYVLFIPLIALVLSIASIVLLAMGKDFVLITDSVDVTKEVVSNVSKLHEVLIGNGFTYSETTMILNIFQSYGFLGILLVLSLISMFIYSGHKMFNGKKSSAGFFALALSWSGLLIILSALFTTLSVSSWAFLFIMIGVLSAMFALDQKLVIKHEFIQFKKRSQGIINGYKLFSLVAIVTIVIGIGYILMNLDEIFLV